MSFKEVTPQDAWKILENNKDSVLVDVRTNEELNFVGFVDLSEIGRKAIALPFRTYPNMAFNSSFISDLTGFINKSFGEDSFKTNLLFLCKTGGRSHDAAIAMSELGYNCYNILGGFEGDIDKFGHRGKINGWKAENLPWRQN